MEYLITYPSGREFKLSGEFRTLPPLPGSRLFNPAILSGSKAYALDPRAIVKTASGETVFTGCSIEDLTKDLEPR